MHKAQSRLQFVLQMLPFGRRTILLFKVAPLFSRGWLFLSSRRNYYLYNGRERDRQDVPLLVQPDASRPVLTQALTLSTLEFPSQIVLVHTLQEIQPCKMS